MIRYFTVFVAFAALSGCATAPNIDVRPVEIEPITEIKSEPFDAQATLSAAQDDFNAERYQDALSGFAKVLVHKPKDKPALIGSGESFLALGEYQKAAIIFWDEQFSDDEDQDEIRIGKILSGVYTDRFDNPQKAINDGLVFAPGDARLWNAKGQYHDRADEWMDALACYVHALGTDKWRSGTINNMGMSLLLQERYAEAESKFSQAMKISPQTDIYDNNRRMSLILSGQLKAALIDIEDNRAADILNDAGYVALQSGKSKRARLLFQMALDTSPVHHVKAEANLARVNAL